MEETKLDVRASKFELSEFQLFHGDYSTVYYDLLEVESGQSIGSLGCFSNRSVEEPQGLSVFHWETGEGWDQSFHLERFLSLLANTYGVASLNLERDSSFHASLKGHCDSSDGPKGLSLRRLTIRPKFPRNFSGPLDWYERVAPSQWKKYKKSRFFKNRRRALASQWCTCLWSSSSE